MTVSTQWQLARRAAERYQRVLTPTILGPFAQALVTHAALQSGERVLDVGCGTGAATRVAAETVGPTGHVLGVDVNPSMIDVARSLPAVPGAPLEWRVATATSLPLDEQSVDVVLCAQTLQFLPEKQLSLAEMHRVLKVGGRLALSLWCAIEDNPYFHALVEAVAVHVGVEVAAGLKSAFALPNASTIHGLLKAAHFTQIEVNVVRLDLPVPELAEFVPRHISATPMDAGFQRAAPTVKQMIIREVSERLCAYQTTSQLQIPFKSNLFVGKR